MAGRRVWELLPTLTEHFSESTAFPQKATQCAAFLFFHADQPAASMFPQQRALPCCPRLFWARGLPSDGAPPPGTSAALAHTRLRSGESHPRGPLVVGASPERGYCTSSRASRRASHPHRLNPKPTARRAGASAPQPWGRRRPGASPSVVPIAHHQGCLLGENSGERPMRVILQELATTNTRELYVLAARHAPKCHSLRSGGRRGVPPQRPPG